MNIEDICNLESIKDSFLLEKAIQIIDEKNKLLKS